MATIMRKMNMISRCESIYRTQQLDGVDLQGVHHSFILAICNNPGKSQEWLAQHICLNKSNITRHLSHLEQNGYIQRKSDDHDKRILLVYPTAKMLEILPEARKIVERWNGYIAQDFSAEELKLFHSMLDRMEMRAKELVYREEESL